MYCSLCPKFFQDWISDIFAVESVDIRASAYREWEENLARYEALSCRQLSMLEQ